jgi:hypothetical protein
MIRKAYIIAIVALGLTAGAVHTSPLFGRFVSSAQSFHSYYRDLQQPGNSMGPIERFVFSLVLANPKVPQAQIPSAAPEHRT